MSLFSLLASAGLLAPTRAEAVTPSVSVKLSKSVLVAGESTRVTVTVKRGVAGQVVSVQRKSGSRWVSVISKKLPRKGKTKRVMLDFAPAQNRKYRVLVAKKGPVRAVTSALRITVNRPTATPLPVPPKAPLKFDFRNATGLAIGANGIPNSVSRAPSARTTTATPETGSNLDVVGPDGAVRDAVTSGSATVGSFLIAPNDKVYVTFMQRVDLADTSNYSATGCLLAEVDQVSGLPRCVDNSLDWIRAGKNSVQFDAAGAIYYSGYEYSDQPGAQGTEVLRRYLDGAVSDFANPNVSIRDWHVLPNGWILATGTTNSTQARWTRALNPQGGLIALYGEHFWGNQFPDGNFYFNELGCSGISGIRRLDTTAMQLDAQMYVREIPDRTATTPAECEGPRSPYFGSFLGKRYTTPDGRVISYSTPGPYNSQVQIARLFPTLPAPDGGFDWDETNPLPVPVISDDGFYRQVDVFLGGITVASPVGSSILFAGTHDGKNKLVSVDRNQWALSDISLPGEIEFYDITAESESAAIFNGLRFSDNRVVVGRIDLITGEVEVLSTIPTKWNEFQAF